MPDVATYQQEHLRNYIAPIVPKVMLCVAGIFCVTVIGYLTGVLPSWTGAASVLAVGGILSVVLALLSHWAGTRGRVNTAGYLCVAFILVVCGCTAVDTFLSDQDVMYAWPYSVLASVGASFFWLRRHHFILSLFAAFGPTLILTLTRTPSSQEWTFIAQLVLITVIASSAIHVLTSRTNRRISILTSELMRRASYDGPTQVLNRTAWWERATVKLQVGQASARPTSCLFIDLDHLKRVNDDHGHSVGDGLLKEVAATLTQNTLDNCLIGRLGGDEFAVLMPGVGETEAQAFAARIQLELRTIHHPVSAQAASIGVATSYDLETLDDLVQRADLAMLAAKGSNRRPTHAEHIEVPPVDQPAASYAVSI